MAEKEKKPTELEQFVQYMNAIEGLAKPLQELQELEGDSRPGSDKDKKIDGARKNITKTGYDLAVRKGVIKKDDVKPEDFDYELARGYIGGEISLNEQDASRVMIGKGNLESMVKAVGKDKLEKIVRDQETGQAIASKAEDKYKEWLQLYVTTQGTKDLLDATKDPKKLNDEQKQLLLQGAAKKAREERTKEYLDKGYDKSRSENQGALAARAVLAYKQNDSKTLESGAKAIYEDSMKKLSDYEKSSGIDIVKYVTEGLGKLNSGKAEEHSIAKQILYRAAKPEEKKEDKKKN